MKKIIQTSSTIMNEAGFMRTASIIKELNKMEISNSETH